MTLESVRILFSPVSQVFSFTSEIVVTFGAIEILLMPCYPFV